MTEPPQSDRQRSPTSDDARPVVLHARVVTSTGGGPDKTILNSPRFLKRHGYESSCMFFRPPCDDGFDALRARAEQWSAPLIEIDDRSKVDIRAIGAAIKACRKHNVAIWHAHDYKTNLIGLIAKRFHRMKLITTAHGWVNFDGQTPRYYRMDKRWFLPRYDKIICVSSTVMDECIDAGVPAELCVMIDNAIDHEEFCRRIPLLDAKRQRWNSPPDQLVIGAIGRLAEEKGFDLLVEAFARLVAEGLDAKLVIAGEGPEQGHLQNQINALGLAERVELVGFCQDTRAFYESLDLFVLSSHREGLPNVVLEAMSVGAAVIATNVGGVARVVQDGTNGLLIESGQIDAIAQAISTLASDQLLRTRMATCGLETISNDWSFSTRIEKVAGIYGQILHQEASLTV